MTEALTGTMILLLPLIGLLAGVLGGMLGIGGGLIMIPALVFLLGENVFGPDSFHSFKLGAISTAVILSIPVVRQHLAAGALVGAILRSILPGAMLGVVVGALLSSQFSGESAQVLRRIFGGVMVAAVGLSIWQSRGRDRARSCPTGRRWLLYSLGVGLPAGLLAGLLGVGGGVWAVPVQNHLCGLRLRNAIANSGCAILVISIAAAIAQVMVMEGIGAPFHHGFLLAGLLTPGALLGGWWGAALTHRLPVAMLREAFHALLVLAGLRLILQ